MGAAAGPPGRRVPHTCCRRPTTLIRCSTQFHLFLACFNSSSIPGVLISATACSCAGRGRLPTSRPRHCRSQSWRRRLPAAARGGGRWPPRDRTPRRRSCPAQTPPLRGGGRGPAEPEREGDARLLGGQGQERRRQQAGRQRGRVMAAVQAAPTPAGSTCLGSHGHKIPLRWSPPSRRQSPQRQTAPPPATCRRRRSKGGGVRDGGEGAGTAAQRGGQGVGQGKPGGTPAGQAGRCTKGGQ